MPYVETGIFKRRKFYYGDSSHVTHGMPGHESMDVINQLLLEKVLNGEQNTPEYWNMLANKKLMERNLANTKMEGGYYYCNHKWDDYHRGDIDSDFYESGYKCVLCSGIIVTCRINST